MEHSQESTTYWDTKLTSINLGAYETVVCPAHEYTRGNLAFAETILVDKSAVKNQRVLVERYRAEGKPSLPTTIGLEKQINPFLQAKNLDEFTQWRLAKDKF